MAANNYETVFIAEPEITNEQADSLLNKIKQVITGQSGNVTHEDRWGRKRLAYSIQGHREGFYVVLTHTAEAGVVAALDHFFNVTDTVIRHMTTRVIKKNKTFRPRRERPAGAPEGQRMGGRSGSGYRGNRPSGPSAPRPAEASAPAAAPVTPAPTPAPAAEAAPASGEGSK